MCGRNEIRNGTWEPWEASVPTLCVTFIMRDEEAGERGGHHLTAPLFLLALASLRFQHALQLLLWKARLVVDKRRKG